MYQFCKQNNVHSYWTIIIHVIYKTQIGLANLFFNGAGGTSRTFQNIKNKDGGE